MRAQDIPQHFRTSVALRAETRRRAAPFAIYTRRATNSARAKPRARPAACARESSWPARTAGCAPHSRPSRPMPARPNANSDAPPRHPAHRGTSIRPNARADPGRYPRSRGKSRHRSRRSLRASRGGKARPIRSETGLSSATGKSSGGRPWPRCLLLPSRAISMPAESIRSSPKRRTCEAHIPTSGRDSTAASNASSHPGAGAASSFRLTTNAEVEASIPWLIAAPKPWLEVFSMIRTLAAIPLIFANPRPLLSTTITSKSLRVCRLSASMHSRSRASAVSVGIIIETKISGKVLFYSAEALLPANGGFHNLSARNIGFFSREGDRPQCSCGGNILRGGYA